MDSTKRLNVIPNNVNIETLLTKNGDEPSSIL